MTTRSKPCSSRRLQTPNVLGGEAFAQGRRLNCLVALDEAHRYVRTFTRSDDGSEMAQLTKRFVDAVRTTRKYGLGYLFITQTIASLHKEIIGQLRVTAFGYGLTMGGEIDTISEMVGSGDALSLYRAFVDPQTRKEFPFMIGGPVSPLSFTGAPLFVQMVTRFESFCEQNDWAKSLDSDKSPVVYPEPKNTFASREAFEAARASDFD